MNLTVIKEVASAKMFNAILVSEGKGTDHTEALNDALTNIDVPELSKYLILDIQYLIDGGIGSICLITYVNLEYCQNNGITVQNSSDYLPKV